MLHFPVISNYGKTHEELAKITIGTLTTRSFSACYSFRCRWKVTELFEKITSTTPELQRSVLVSTCWHNISSHSLHLFPPTHSLAINNSSTYVVNALARQNYGESANVLDACHNRHLLWVSLRHISGNCRAVKTNREKWKLRGKSSEILCAFIGFIEKRKTRSLCVLDVDFAVLAGNCREKISQYFFF